MTAQHDVQVAKQAGLHHVGPAGEQFLGDTGIYANGPLYFVFRHDLLQHQGGRHVHRLAGVVAFPVAGSAGYQRRVVSHAGLLRRLRQAIDIGHESDHRFPRSPRGDERRRHSGHAAGDLKPIFLEQARDVSRSLHFLKSKLGEAEDFVHHLLREGFSLVDKRARLGLQFFERRRLRGERN